ncbi:hypothetical protein BGZ60DRAFT_132822 [Tricladium varicosporioides]|nr:hypothetical protein BGZ60DRAFT_132822 [Hymenoscyphus varicosporioides]
MWAEQDRVEELDSDDDSDTQGVGLKFKGNQFTSDSLQFTGGDLAPTTRARRSYAFDDEDSSDDSAASEESAMQIALRDKEEALVQSALARIRRAQEKGKREVKLNQDELDALEKRRRRMQAAATTKNRERSGSSGSEKQRRMERNITIPIGPPAAPIESIGRKKGKSKRKEKEETPPPATGAPGMLIAGPDGLMYAPIGYGPINSTGNRDSPNRSPNRPRSQSTQVLGSQAPAQFTYQGGQSSRHFSDGMRPTSSSSNRSNRPLPDEAEWIPSNSRRSSVSSQHSLNPFDYQTSSEHPPPIPQQYIQAGPAGRRIVSNPHNIQYSTLPRNTISSGSGSYAAARGAPLPRRGDPFRDELADSPGTPTSDETDEDELGNGVQVYTEERVIKEPVSRKSVGQPKKRRRSK